MLNIILLISGSVFAVFGLLQAAHSPFQKWWYSREKKEPVDIESEEYKTAVFHMKIAGGGAVLIGALMILYTLSEFGLID